jgi:hypothetical protein
LAVASILGKTAARQALVYQRLEEHGTSLNSKPSHYHNLRAYTKLIVVASKYSTAQKRVWKTNGEQLAFHKMAHHYHHQAASAWKGTNESDPRHSGNLETNK